MKRLGIILFLLIITTFLTSCSFLQADDIDKAYYGVAGYVEIGDGLSALSVNITDLGWVVIPDLDKVIVGGVFNEDYEIQEGDLIKIWFDRTKDIGLKESFPAQFAKDPDSITLVEQNVILQQNGDSSWLIELDASSLIYDVDFTVSAAKIGDELEIKYSTIVESVPIENTFFNTSIISVSENRISFNVPNEEIKDFLIYFEEDNIIIFEFLND
ncbi:MAG: hypothetical protein JEZ05_11095 [Tenericutes bacterium]|nr:hypothetical protein [Mycoplasmatota bacterium]